jgi:hypothetical protein
MKLFELQLFDNLHGVSGLLSFLNHPLREPKLNDELMNIYQRLYKEAYDEEKHTPRGFNPSGA